MRKILVIIVILVVAFVLIISYNNISKTENGEDYMNSKKEAPNFELTDFEGNKVVLSDFKGKPLYIKFWASWCSICLSTMAETEALSVAENDFDVITVVAPNFSGEKSAEDFKIWYNGLEYKNITVLLDQDGKYMKQFGVRAFPSSAYIDSEGFLIDFSVGHVDIDKIKSVFSGSKENADTSFAGDDSFDFSNIESLKTIYLAGGCFWGVEEFMSRVTGVMDARSGYANGNTKNPTYEEVCTQNTGHAETVEVLYDSSVLPLEVLLKGYFAIIDPTRSDGQGNDIGTQYRTGIYFVNNDDLSIIDEVVSQEQKKYKKDIVTEVLPLDNFYLAEEYHQDFLKKNPNGYCHIDLTLAEDVGV